jgi:flagellar motility protein MotE (MotC chaperone)
MRERILALLRSLIGIVTIAMAVTFAAVIMLVILLWTMDVVNIEKTKTIMKVLKGEKSVRVETVVKPPDEFIKDIEEQRASVEKGLRQKESDIEIQGLALAQQKSDVEKEKLLLAAQKEAFLAEKAAYETARRAEAGQKQSETFQKLVTLFDRLPAKDVVEMVKDWDVPEIISYLMAIKERNAQKIISEMLNLQDAAKVYPEKGILVMKEFAKRASPETKPQ